MTFTLSGRISIDGKPARAELESTAAATEKVRSGTAGLGAEGRQTSADFAALRAEVAAYKAQILAMDTAQQQAMARMDAMAAEHQQALAALQGNVGGVGRASNIAAGQVGNLTAQFNDIGMMLMAGQNPLQLAIQQGTQITQVIGPMGARGAVTALGGALMGMLNPVSLITIGSIAAGAAMLQWFTGSTEKAITFEDTIKTLEDAVDAYAKASERARMSGAELTREFGNQQRGARALLADVAELTLREAERALKSQMTGLENDLQVAVPRFDTGDQKRMADFFDLSMWSRESRSAINGVLISMGEIKQTKVLDEQIAAAERLKDRFEAAARASGKITAEEDAALAKILAMIDAMNRLRVEQEKAAAAAAMRSAMMTYGPYGASRLENRAAMLEITEQIRLLDQQNAVQEAGIRFGTDSLEVARLRAEEERRTLEITLQGLEVSESMKDELRAAFEAGRRLNELRLEAGLSSAERVARRIAEQMGITYETAKKLDALGPQGIVRPDPSGEVYSGRGPTNPSVADSFIASQGGVTVETVARMKAIEESAARAARALTEIPEYWRNQADVTENLQAELGLIGATAAKRREVLALLKAEQQIREWGLASSSEMAERIRAETRAQAALTSQIEKQAAAWDMVKGSAEGAIDGAIDSLLKGDFPGALESIATEMTSLFADLALKNPMKNAILGTDYTTMTDVGGIQGIFERLMGGGEQSKLSMSTMGPVASMAVTAGNVMINGSVLGGGFGGVANINGSPASMLGEVPAKIWDYFTRKGLAPHQVSGILGNVSAESAFNPRAVGDNGTSFGLFQHHAGRGQGLLGAVGGQSGLGNVQAQLDYVWQELLSSESGVLQRLLASKDVAGATAAFAGFERPQGWSMANPQGSHNFDGRMAAAEAAMGKFATTAAGATSNLDVLGSGFNVFGNALASIPAGGAAGGSAGGGWMDMIANAIGGALNIPGFARGGHTGGSDPSRVAGVVHEEEYVFDAASTRRIGVDALEAMRRGTLKGFRTGGYVPKAPGYFPAGSGSAEKSSMPQITFIDNSSQKHTMEAEESTDASGGRSLTFTMADVVGQAMAKKGGGANRALRQMGVRRPRAARG